MRRTVVQIIFSVLCLSSQAQKVSNIRAEQRGQDIVILYSLETTSPAEVSLLLSQDNGVTWGSPLKNVYGDVGKNISAGEKQINWNVLEEREQLVGDKIKFKVVANGKKSFEPEMVFVEGGTFQMGGDGAGGFKTVSTSSFRIGKYEVTQAQWRAVMGNNPSRLNKECDKCPVENISWNDAQEYIRRLNDLTKRGYRLPTPPEWEYASKGGKLSKGFVYSGSNNVNTVAWYCDNAGQKTHPVGTKQGNELGLYDMSGNVEEWCFVDPSLVTTQVLRGGSVGGSGVYRCEEECRNQISDHCVPSGRHWASGLRLVLPVEK